MLTVTDVMTTNVFTIRSSAKVTQAIALMQEKQVRSLIVEPAVQGGAYGMITEQDIVYKVMANSADPLHTMVCEIMDDHCPCIEPTLSLSEVAKAFAENHIQRAPVVKQDHLIGVLSVTDILMKSSVEAVELPPDWANHIESALRRKRLCWGEDVQQAETDRTAARQILEELCA